jgi:RNA-binding protein
MSLSPNQRQFLKGLAHGLSPIVQIGGAGVTDAVTRATDAALEDHELIKVKLPKGWEGDRRETARELALSVRGEVCQVIGRVIVIYRRRLTDGRERIELPA